MPSQHRANICITDPKTGDLVCDGVNGIARVLGYTTPLSKKRLFRLLKKDKIEYYEEKEETKAEETKAEETKAEESKPEPKPEPKAEEVKTETKAEEKEETKTEEPKKQTKTEVKKEPKSMPVPAGDDHLGQIIAQYVSKYLDIKAEAEVDEGKVRQIITEQIAQVKPIRIEMPKTGEIKDLGIQHNKFESLLKIASLKLHSILVGPAGSGKSTAAKNVAKALDRAFYVMPIGIQSSKFDFLGYTDANGNYVTTLFREAYENGGVFLLDEVDAGNPNVLTIINGAIENGICAFPDGEIVEAHEDFVLVASANTYGRGADRMYVGRNQLDGAFLNRFVVIDWGYDEEMESALATNKKWCKRVQSIRAKVEKHKMRLIVSPRATFKGQAMLEAGFSQDEVEHMLIWQGLPDTEIKKVA